MAIKLTDYLDEFVITLKKYLEEEKDNNWMKIPIEEQEIHIMGFIGQYFERYLTTHQQISWFGVARYALIGWLMENHPELFI